MSTDREMLRHTIATLAYRGGKALRGAPAEFSHFKLGDKRAAGEILAHIGDLFDWGLTMMKGKQVWNPQPPRSWAEDTARFHAGLQAMDDYLASGEPLAAPVGTIFQGPVADALTHVGQINLMRRLAGHPVRGENYAKASIEAGRVGADQAESRVEFD